MIDFSDAKPTLRSLGKFQLVMVFSPFYMLFDLVGWYFVEDFLHLYKKHWCIWFFFLLLFVCLFFPFLVISLSGFGIRVITAS